MSPNTSPPPDPAADVSRLPRHTGARVRMLTGDRPTGRLHLGHLVGSIDNRVRLQHRYETFLIIADVHMLTMKNSRADTERVAANARTMVLDQLAAGIDPEAATFYLQSAIPEVNDLAMPLQTLVTVPRLQHVPSLKDMAGAAGAAEMTFGLLGYPVLQAADILCVKGGVVPVGKDNHAYVEGDPGDRSPLQPPLRRGLPGAGHRGIGGDDAHRYRWQGEDEQVAGQRDLPLRRRSDVAAQSRSHICRSGARSSRVGPVSWTRSSSMGRSAPARSCAASWPKRGRRWGSRAMRDCAVGPSGPDDTRSEVPGEKQRGVSR